MDGADLISVAQSHLTRKINPKTHCGCLRDVAMAKIRRALETADRSRRLKRAQAEEIRHLNSKGAGIAELADQYCVNRKTVSKIVNGETHTKPDRETLPRYVPSVEGTRRVKLNVATAREVEISRLMVESANGWWIEDITRQVNRCLEFTGPDWLARCRAGEPMAVAALHHLPSDVRDYLELEWAA